jgi:TolA-binding protein
MYNRFNNNFPNFEYFAYLPALCKHLGDIFIPCMHNTCNMQEQKRKISVWVPSELYDSVLYAGYTSPTNAVIQGFEMLTRAQSEDSPEEVRRQMQVIRRQMQAEIDTLKNEIERLNASLQEAPDPTEFIEIRARSRELERHNETLKKELEISQETHRNYMMQMQTLITQKQIEVPGAKKPWWRFW